MKLQKNIRNGGTRVQVGKEEVPKSFISSEFDLLLTIWGYVHRPIAEQSCQPVVLTNHSWFGPWDNLLS